MLIITQPSKPSQLPEMTYSFFKCKQTFYNCIHITGEKTDFVGILGETSTLNPAITLVCSYMCTLWLAYYFSQNKKLRVEKKWGWGEIRPLSFNQCKFKLFLLYWPLFSYQYEQPNVTSTTWCSFQQQPRTVGSRHDKFEIQANSQFFFTLILKVGIWRLATCLNQRNVSTSVKFNSSPECVRSLHLDTNFIAKYRLNKTTGKEN